MRIKKYLTLSLFLLLLVGCGGGQISSIEASSSSSEASSTSSLSSKYQELEITKPIQTLFEGACPSKGNVKALVVPIHFSNDSTSINNQVIHAAMDNSSSFISPEWYSVKDFYKISSYNQLSFDFTFTDTYIPKYESTYYASKANFNGDSYNTNASRALYKEVLEAFDNQYNYKDYDSNNDGYIDFIYLIYDHPVDYTYSNMFWWAYTSWYEDSDTFDSCKLGRYVWCGQDFFYKDNSSCNTQTIIHETSHLFGIDDYYDYDTTKGATKGGLAGADLMDNNQGSPCGDHNSYSKSLLGWTKPKVITLSGKDDEIEISLNAFEDNGDCLIIANDFDISKEMYQEYFLVEYYTPTKLMEKDKPFTNSGIRVLHVSSQLDSKGKIKYDNSYTSYKLISQITTSTGGTYINSSTTKDDSTLFTLDKELTNVEYNNGDSLKYAFKVVSQANDKITLKITQKF